jgi:hypothetical protein
MKKNLPTQDSVKRLMEQTLKNILSCVGGVYYNKYKLKKKLIKGTIICKAKKCNNYLYKNQSTSNREYCSECL